MSESCGTCWFASPQEPDLPGDTICRRRAPTIYTLKGMVNCGWPPVDMSQWCGEWSGTAPVREIAPTIPNEGPP